MLHRSTIRPILVLGLMTAIAEAQQATAPPSMKPTPSPYKVAFWYDADRPTTTLKYQVYDLAKGEYDEKAVNRWLRTILDKYPNHGAYVRDIQTEGLPGATEHERLALAIEHEKRPLGRPATPDLEAGPRAHRDLGDRIPETPHRDAQPDLFQSPRAGLAGDHVQAARLAFPLPLSLGSSLGSRMVDETMVDDRSRNLDGSSIGHRLIDHPGAKRVSRAGRPIRAQTTAAPEGVGAAVRGGIGQARIRGRRRSRAWSPGGRRRRLRASLPSEG